MVLTREHIEKKWKERLEENAENQYSKANPFLSKYAAGELSSTKHGTKKRFLLMARDYF